MATCKEEIHVGDIGTAFRVTLLDDCLTAVDLTGFSSLEVIFQKPDGTNVTKTASVYEGLPQNGVVEYITIADDLDQVGTWKIQAKVVLPTGTWRSSIDKFKVYANLI